MNSGFYAMSPTSKKTHLTVLMAKGDKILSIRTLRGEFDKKIKCMESEGWVCKNDPYHDGKYAKVLYGNFKEAVG